MCNFCNLFFCCFRNDREETNQRKKRRKRKTETSHKYGTDWQTVVDKIEDPTVIDDKLVSKQLDIDATKFTNRIDWFNEVLRQEGSQCVIAEPEPLGKGSYGSVYKIKNVDTGVFYAMKLMRIGDPTARDVLRFKMFKREIFALTRAQHKNIIHLFGHFLVESFCFMIMEFATGGDLKRRLAEKNETDGKGFNELEAKDYFAQISNAMYFVHSNKLIHGDLKLENILITTINDKEVLKVTDFGCARVGYKEDSGMMRQNRAVGTVAYMAPEQLRVFVAINLQAPHLVSHGRTYNPMRADVWSLGICLYRMFNVKNPFLYDNSRALKTSMDILKQMRTGFDLPKNISQTLSKECLDMLMSLLEYDKRNRISMEEVMRHPWVYNSTYLDKI